jgi:hypothetical protein
MPDNFLADGELNIGKYLIILMLMPIAHGRPILRHLQNHPKSFLVAELQFHRAD